MRPSIASTPGALRVVAELPQFRYETIAVIALNLDDTLSHRTTRPAESLQPPSEFLEFYCAERQTVDDRHPFAGTTGYLTADTNESCPAPRRRRPRESPRARWIGFYYHAAERMLRLQSSPTMSHVAAVRVANVKDHKWSREWPD